MYEYKHLPAYARFLLNNHIDEYAGEQIRLSRLLKLPVLESLLQRFSEEAMYRISAITSREYLEFIAANQGKEQIMMSVNRWMKHQHNFVGQSELAAKDITLLNYIRAVSYTHLTLPTSDLV